jgi:hypothetical protein
VGIIIVLGFINHWNKTHKKGCDPKDVKYVSVTSFKEFTFNETELKSKTLSNPENNNIEINREYLNYFVNKNKNIYDEILNRIKIGNHQQYNQLIEKQKDCLNNKISNLYELQCMKVTNNWVKMKEFGIFDVNNYLIEFQGKISSGKYWFKYKITYNVNNSEIVLVNGTYKDNLEYNTNNNCHQYRVFTLLISPIPCPSNLIIWFRICDQNGNDVNDITQQIFNIKEVHITKIC